MTIARKNKGFFITFEGGEGAGKTTLIQSLYEYLSEKKFPTLKTCEPGGTAFGQYIRDILLHHTDYSFGKKSELFLFLADRAQHVEEKILPYLQENAIVLCDRFNDSTFAYQGIARSFDESLLTSFCQFAASNLQPDLTFFLDLDPSIGLQRSCKSKKLGVSLDRIEQEEISFHIKVRQAFLDLAAKEPERCYVLDASQNPNEVFKRAVDQIQPRLKIMSCTN